MELKQLEKISKALGDATRLKILTGIAGCKGNFQCSNIKNITHLAQPSVSHHIKTLIEAELIEPEKDGRTHSYILNRDTFSKYLDSLSTFAAQ